MIVEADGPGVAGATFDDDAFCSQGEDGGGAEHGHGVGGFDEFREGSQPNAAADGDFWGFWGGGHGDWGRGR